MTWGEYWRRYPYADTVRLIQEGVVEFGHPEDGLDAVRINDEAALIAAEAVERLRNEEER